MWLFSKKKRAASAPCAEESKQPAVDFGGLLANIQKRNEAEALYKQLCRACHPDKFDNDPARRPLAAELFRRVQAARNNYAALVHVSTLIPEQLNIPSI